MHQGGSMGGSRGQQLTTAAAVTAVCANAEQWKKPEFLVLHHLKGGSGQQLTVQAAAVVRRHGCLRKREAVLQSHMSGMCRPVVEGRASCVDE